MAIIVCRCSSCQKDLGIYDAHSAWLKLFHYLEIELMEEQITEATFGILVDALEAVRPQKEIDGH